MQARDLMTKRVVTVSPGNSVRHAAQIMRDNAASGLPVVDDNGKLVGIITEGDLLRRAEFGLKSDSEPGLAASEQQPAITSYRKSHGWSVADAMTSEVISVDETVTSKHIARLMRQHGIKRVPVVKDGKVIGIVSRADLLGVIIMAEPDCIAPGDAAIKRSIKARLAEVDGLDTRHIEVAVENGSVHFSGAACSDVEQDVARAVAENVGGVFGISDHRKIVK